MDVETNLPWHVCAKYTVRADSAGEAQGSAWPKHVFLDRNGTNDHEQPHSVPLVPMFFGGRSDTP